MPEYLRVLMYVFLGYVAVAYAVTVIYSIKKSGERYWSSHKSSLHFFAALVLSLVLSFFFMGLMMWEIPVVIFGKCRKILHLSDGRS